MRKIVFILSFVLVLFQSMRISAHEIMPAKNLETTQQHFLFFSHHSQNDIPNFYDYILEEDNDVSTSARKKKSSEKTTFSTLSLSLVVFDFLGNFSKITHTKNYLPSVTFLSLRILRL